MPLASRGDAGRTPGELAGLLFGQLHQVLEVARGQRGVDHHDKRLLGGAGDGQQVLDRVEADVVVDVGVDGEHALVGQGDGVAVGRRLHAHEGADVALRAGAVVDDDLLVPDLAQLHRQNPRERIGATTGREGHDDAHRLVRPGQRGAGERHGKQYGTQAGEHAGEQASVQENAGALHGCLRLEWTGFAQVCAGQAFHVMLAPPEGMWPARQQGTKT